MTDRPYHFLLTALQILTGACMAGVGGLLTSTDPAAGAIMITVGVLIAAFGAAASK